MSIIFFVIGACLGSFMNVVISRNDWYKGRSRCDSCGHVLKWYELIPIISYILQKGKCRECKAEIDKLHFVSELLMGIGLAIVSSYYKTDFMTAIIFMVAVIFLCICAISDIKETAVSVVYLYGGIACITLVKAFVYIMLSGYAELIMFILINMSVYIVLFLISKLSKKHIGEGDFDIFMMIFLALGWFNTITCITLASLVGTCIYLPLVISGKYDRKKPIPLAPLLYFGFLITILGGKIF